MGGGASNFVHNAYDFYQKPEIQIPLQVGKLVYYGYEMAKLSTHDRCYYCNELYLGYEGDNNMCDKCRYKDLDKY